VVVVVLSDVEDRRTPRLVAHKHDVARIVEDVSAPRVMSSARRDEAHRVQDLVEHRGRDRPCRYSHSIVAGGFDETS
jgi:hypothetical protein